jgi:hypothetical protein
VSDHDLLFSKEDTTKAGEGATTLKSVRAFGGETGKASGGGSNAGKGCGAGKGGKGGGWKGVDSGWGGDAQLGILAAAAGSVFAAPPASFAAKNKEVAAEALAERRGRSGSGSGGSPSPADRTKSKALEKLVALREQKEKQESLLDMPGVLKKLPDKGKSIVERIAVLASEIETFEAELVAKHGGGLVFRVPVPPTETPARLSPTAPAVLLETPATVLSPSPSSSSTGISERVSLVSPDVSEKVSLVSPDVSEKVSLVTPERGTSEDSFHGASSAPEDADETVDAEALDTSLELEEIDKTVEMEEMDDLANMMGTMGM